MYDFETLVDEVLRNKPEISRNELMELIQEKKQNVGAGYLTDQGALFLIAGELGVQLKRVTSSDLTLKDLYIGANDITIVARVLAIYPIAEFSKKDGSKGSYRRLNLFDQGNITKLTIWEDNEAIHHLDGIGVDTPVRIMNGYVKQGLDGKPNLNLGKRGKLEVLKDDSLIAKLASLESVVMNIEKLEEEQINIPVLDGLVCSNSRSSNFTRQDGSAGSLTQFELSSSSSSSSSSNGIRKRVVIWNGVNLPDITVGQNVRVTNLRVKKTARGEVELHGDSGSAVSQLMPPTSSSAGTRPASTPSLSGPKLSKLREINDNSGQISVEVMVLSKGSAHDVRLKDGTSMSKGELVIGDETGEITVVGWGELAKQLTMVDVGERIRIVDVTSQMSKMGTLILQLGRASKIERATL